MRASTLGASGFGSVESARAAVMGTEMLVSLVAVYLPVVAVWRLRPVSRAWLCIPAGRAAAQREFEAPEIEQCTSAADLLQAELFSDLDTIRLQNSGSRCSSRAAMLVEHALARPWLLDTRDCAGRTVLMKAAELGQLQPVLALLAVRADLAARGGNKWTALHFAAVSGRAEMCKLLIGRSADTESRSTDGYPPLFYAHRAGDETVVQQLLACRATPCSAQDRWGFTDTGR